MSRAKVEQLIGLLNSAIVLVALVRLRDLLLFNVIQGEADAPGMVFLMRDKLSVMTACGAQG